METKRRFNHIISLGHFCSVAMELERLGLRTASYPFDWVISDDFEKILSLLANGFQKYVDAENLYQENIPSHYFCPKTGVHFFS